MAKTKTTGGKWYAFLNGKNEPKVAEYSTAQPWGHETREEALRFLRPTVQTAEKSAREKASALAAALATIEGMLKRE